ncbi:MAG: RNA methyltransferase [Bacteroidia bacterium]|nr:RNA methyltransferase [Bacteroidia bacterium]NNF30156.1 RNA methyltransferase [Flavobacteriaceae bacterium]MBT8275034.1 RNA methyltransferase [Bacteroidia bacterium]NNJ81070.1 RNA methyltransferase [Flavobacteriaceae bacterium]NNK55480.1 RNA methyltransferase [Flavobacteriaceae bacterium]
MRKSISSVQNPLVKKISLLIEKSRERRKTGTFVIEGKREIHLATKGDYSIKTVLICPDIYSDNISEFTSEDTEIIEISIEVYQKLSYRKTTEGIIAIAEVNELSLDALQFTKEKPLVLVAEAPEKPGNIGALLRTADAAQLDAVIIANPKTDMFNPNIIRSSVGCLFTNNVATGDTDEIIRFLQKNKIDIYAATLQASVPYQTCDFTRSSAIVVGTEDEGLSESWRVHSTQNIIIPMQGEIDSMNVSVAAGILIFEAKRQRNFEV